MLRARPATENPSESRASCVQTAAPACRGRFISSQPGGLPKPYPSNEACSHKSLKQGTLLQHLVISRFSSVHEHAIRKYNAMLGGHMADKRKKLFYPAGPLTARHTKKQDLTNVHHERNAAPPLAPPLACPHTLSETRSVDLVIVMLLEVFSAQGHVDSDLWKEWLVPESESVWSKSGPPTSEARKLRLFLSGVDCS